MIYVSRGVTFTTTAQETVPCYSHLPPPFISLNDFVLVPLVVVFYIMSTNMPMGNENCYCYACAEIYVPCHMAGRLAMASPWVGLGGKSDI